jgi:hypothetical protein
MLILQQINALLVVQLIIINKIITILERVYKHANHLNLLFI